MLGKLLCSFSTSFDLFLRANLIPAIIKVFEASNLSLLISEKALILIGLMCRFADEKSSINLDNIKAFGLAGAPQVIVQVLKKYNSNQQIVLLCCNSIRNLCSFTKNNQLLGEADACGTVTRVLLKHPNDTAICSWVCRVIGHLAYKNEANRMGLIKAGACEQVVNVLQNHPSHESAAGEACWAIRNLAARSSPENLLQVDDQDEDTAIARLASLMAPEMIIAAMKNHFSSEAFMTEAMRAAVSLLCHPGVPEVVGRFSNAGALSIALKCAKKLQDSDTIAGLTLQLMYYFACDTNIRPKLVGLDILDAITVMVQAHANTEAVSEWGCRTLYQLSLHGSGISSRMRTAGLLETVVGAVQRQAMSEAVAEHGCLTLGALAADSENLYRLIGSGAGAATVGALRQHKKSSNVVARACFAVSNLSQGANNVSWLGACGTCEAIVTALIIHATSDPQVAYIGSKAVAALAYHDDGNIKKLKSAGVSELMVNTLKTHMKNVEVAEHCCRSIYNLCYVSSLVSEMGRCGACEAVVDTCKQHNGVEGVVSSAMLAIGSLAVKRKYEKVHNGNMRKLISSHAIDCVLDGLAKFPGSAYAQRSGGLAVAALARDNSNSEKLHELGAPKLILKAIRVHKDSGDVIGAMFAAVNSLCANVGGNRTFFASNGIINAVFTAIYSHERNELLVAEGFRILVAVAVDIASRKEMSSENQIKLALRAIKIHDKHDFAAKWGCTFLFTVGDNDTVRALIGKYRGCEIVVGVLAKHAEKNDEHDEAHEAYAIGASTVELANRALVSIAMLEENRSKLNTADACQAVVTSVKSHMEDAGAAEWACAAMVSLCGNSNCIHLLGQAGACTVLRQIIKDHMSAEVIVRLVCELIHHLSKDETNRSKFGTSGICETLADALFLHLPNSKVCLQVCRAVCALVKENQLNFEMFSSTNICEEISKVLVTHAFNAATCRWASAAIAVLAESSTNHDALILNGTLESLVGMVEKHKNVQSTFEEVLQAIRAMASKNPATASRLSEAGLLQALFTAISYHNGVVGVAENFGWILGHCTTEHDAEFYNSNESWSKVESILKIHASHESAVRWLCFALGSWASNSISPHPTACELVLSMLVRYGGAPAVVSKSCFAIGCLAMSQVNQEHLSQLGAIEAVANCAIIYSDKSNVKVGIFRAIVGLVGGNVQNQKRFSSVPRACKALVKAVYEDIEYPEITLWGCKALIALMRGNKYTTHYLGSASNYMDEILRQYRGSLDMIKIAFETISLLAHCNTANRSLLGVSGACDEVGSALSQLVYEDMATTQLACRVIANLAANHPNNQHKLGINGACEYLIGVIREQSQSEQDDNLEAIPTTRLATWAIANLVQSGKPTDDLKDEEKKKSPLYILGEGKLKKNSQKLDELQIKDILLALLKKYAADEDTWMWILRCINNLSKGRVLRKKFIEGGVFSLMELLNPTEGSRAAEWLNITRETLNQDAQISKSGILQV